MRRFLPQALYLRICMLVIFSAGTAMAQGESKFLTEGKLLFEKGEFEKAIIQFNKAIPGTCRKGDTTAAAAYYYTGCCYQYLSRFPNSINSFEKALECGYENLAEVYFQMSTSYFNMGDYDKSIFYCNKILAADSQTQDTRVYWRLNIIYNIRGEKEKALEIILRGARNGISEFQTYCKKREISWEQ